MAIEAVSYLSEFQKAAAVDSEKWKRDTQPEIFATTSEYISLAKKMTDPSLKFAVDILVASGHIKAAQSDEILEKLQNLKPKKRLELDGVSIMWRIKDDKSSAAKILKDGKNPHDIGDYFGIKFIGRTVEDVIKLREAVLKANNITSKKDEFLYPSERGYRSHKSHHAVDNDHEQLSIEAIIAHEDFESTDKITHDLINAERNILRKQATEIDPKLSRKFAECSADLKSTRTSINHATAAAAGLNALCAPDAITDCTLNTRNNWARRIVGNIAPAHSPSISYASNQELNLQRRNFA